MHPSWSCSAWRLEGGFLTFNYSVACLYQYASVLVLLSMTAAAISLTIGMVTRSSIMSGILVATILMIHFIMLTTIFVNFGESCYHCVAVTQLSVCYPAE